ncbi:MAG: hypothetical protein J1F63_00700 [Oscillospiraceae bacterium]|nr:hypothetical protein [Oscillospiraceae bacterium]
MRKYFETPEVEMTTLTPDTDVMAASANLVNKKSNMSSVSDTDETKAEIWMGASEGWL